ncbi:MAG: metallophosphoesterase [Neisseriaceae bacterium]|nr:metallophosphoesterase [Neisseriaceae bacterium]
MSLIQPLPDCPVDIVGDIHGEIDALRALLRHLGYDEMGRHPERRRLVFIGDFVDRGVDSVAVVRLIKQLTDNGHLAILGNHELNLLRGDQKDGAGWFFEKQREREKHRYVQYKIASEPEKEEILNYINTLPIALENKNLRIIHAAWLSEPIEKIRKLGNIDAQTAFSELRQLAKEQEKNQAWYDDYQKEHAFYHQHNRDEHFAMPYLPAVGAFDLYHGQANPIRAVACGTEKMADKPFYAAGRWRFVTRYRWWDDYDDDIPVVIGHYWREWYNTPTTEPTDKWLKSRNELFHEPPNHWLGKKKNVFCIDFSIGALWKTRLPQSPFSPEQFRLCAFRLPERVLIFHNGEKVKTKGFQAA